MKRMHVLAGLLATITMLALAPAAPAELVDVKLTTDRSIDCSSIQTIARDLYRDCRTDEEKAIATWYFVRRMMFHWPHIPTWDTVDLINSYGIGLCGYQSKAFAEIAQAGGLKARTLHMPGHVLAEVWYDGDWHFFDCQVGWFAFEKGEDGKLTVASHEDIAKNPDIVLKAREEDRASKPFFQCNDDFREGVRYAKNAQPRGAPKVPDNRLVIRLRPGESITRNWSNEGKSWYDRELAKDNPSFLSLRHPCTASQIDENDPVNWPYWKPYAVRTADAQGRPRYGPKRLFGNGRIVYQPDLTGEGLCEALAGEGMQGLQATQSGLKPASTGEAGWAVFEVRSPYVAVDAWVDLSGACRGEQAMVALYARRPDQKEWTKVWQPKGEGAFDAAQVSLKEIAWEQHRYEVKVEMRAGGEAAETLLRSIRFTTVFINNMYALPYLMPGKNVVRVTAEASEIPNGALLLKYAWEEAGQEKTLEKQIRKLPFETTVTVAGNEIPRMKSVTLSLVR